MPKMKGMDSGIICQSQAKLNYNKATLFFFFKSTIK